MIETTPMTATRVSVPKLATRLASGVLAAVASTALAVPPGFVKQTLSLNAPPVALAYDADGRLYALESAGFGNNEATMRVFAPDGAPVASFPVTGADPLNFFVGGMAYDPVGDRLLITDNTTSGHLYAVGKSGGQTTLASNFPTVAGIAVRATGEIVIATAVGFGNGGVYEIDHDTGAKTQKMLGLDYGAGLAFDGGDLIVQDSASMAPYPGRLQRVPVAPGANGLEFGAPTEILAGMSSSYGVLVDSEGDILTTGRGGVFAVGGNPAAETLFDNDGGGDSQYATAIALAGGTAPFEPFAGPHGGVLAVTANGGFVSEDLFVTLFTPARPEDFNSDGLVDANDLAIWRLHFGEVPALREQGDADGDQDVDGADFLRWQRALGESTLLTGAPHRPAAINAANRVPEPIFWTTCASAMFVVFPYFRRLTRSDS